jgi:hypothetical protein
VNTLRRGKPGYYGSGFEGPVAALALVLGNLSRLDIEHIAHNDAVGEVGRRNRGGGRSDASGLQRGLRLRGILGLGESRCAE